MKRKGFTLIELLAVLVVLAILALIAVPMVISIINNARENSYKRSIESYGRAVENAVGEYLLDHDISYSEIGSKYDSQRIDDVTIDYSGQTVKCDDLNVNHSGLITLINCRVYNSNNNPLSKVYKYENRKVTEEITYKSYSIGDTFTLKGDSYHIIVDSPAVNDYVVALKDEPLTLAEVTTYGTGHINRYTSSSVGVPTNRNGYGGIAYYSSETCYHSYSTSDRSGCTTSYAQSDVRYVIDAWAATFTSNELKIVNDYSARLITKDEYDGISNNYSWKYNNNYKYWTISQCNDPTLVFHVQASGLMCTAIDNNDATIRPVINVYKSAIGN